MTIKYPKTKKRVQEYKKNELVSCSRRVSIFLRLGLLSNESVHTAASLMSLALSTSALAAITLDSPNLLACAAEDKDCCKS